MARYVDLVTLRSRVRWRTDTMNEVARFPDAEVNDCINEGIANFHMELLRVRGQGFNEATTTFNTTIGTELYSLPAQFLQCLKVWTIRDSCEYVLRTYEEIETDGMSDLASWDTCTGWSYRISGDNISIRPRPKTVKTIYVKYVPSAVKLVADSNTVDGVDGLEEYIVAWAGQRIAIKNRDEWLSGQFDKEMSLALDKLRTTQASRNAAEPPRMQDVRGRAGYWGTRYHRRGRP